MTLGERIASLRDAWAMLPNDGHLVIVETPNRLWWFDDHTAELPFFHWLPDELAFEQSRHSPWRTSASCIRDYTPEAEKHFLRRGRGMSFHEIDTAICPIGDVEVISSLSSFWGVRSSVRRSLLDHQYKRLLRKMYPGLHPGWFDNLLYLIIRKP